MLGIGHSVKSLGCGAHRLPDMAVIREISTTESGNDLVTIFSRASMCDTVGAL